jgi:hypothetical protein
MSVDLKTGKTKIVKYLGNLYEVPMWAKFIAADLDGSICIHEQQPTWNREEYYSSGKIECLSRVSDQPSLLAI